LERQRGRGVEREKSALDARGLRPRRDRTCDPLIKSLVDGASAPYSPGLEPGFFEDSPDAE
jgi:hypothetical protein